MKITVKASGILGEHISVNNALVPKAMHREKMLNDGDEVVVMPPLKGG